MIRVSKLSAPEQWYNMASHASLILTDELLYQTLGWRQAARQLKIAKAERPRTLRHHNHEQRHLPRGWSYGPYRFVGARVRTGFRHLGTKRNAASPTGA